MEDKIPERRHPIITRSNLRDIVIVISLVSAFVIDIGNTRILLSFLLLGLGCFFHLVTKGILVRNVVLCTDGTYSLTRHPYYLANYMIDSSFCLLSGNTYLLLIYPFLFFWAYGLTMAREEDALASMHGERFRSYSLEVPQVFPDPNTIRGWRRMMNGFSRKRITPTELSRFARFWATGFFIVFVHEISRTDFVSTSPLSLWHNHIAITFLLGIASFAFSIVVQTKHKKTA